MSCKADGHHGPSSDQPGDLASEAAAGSWGRSSSGKKRTSCLNQSHIHFKCHAAWWRTSSVPAGEFSLPADGVSTCGRSGTRGRAWQGGERGHRRRWPVRLSQPRTSAPARGSVTHGGWQLHRFAHMASPIQNRSPALLPVKNPAAVAGVTTEVQVRPPAWPSGLRALYGHRCGVWIQSLAWERPDPEGACGPAICLAPFRPVPGRCSWRAGECACRPSTAVVQSP